MVTPASRPAGAIYVGRQGTLTLTAGSIDHNQALGWEAGGSGGAGGEGGTAFGSSGGSITGGSGSGFPTGSVANLPPDPVLPDGGPGGNGGLGAARRGGGLYVASGSLTITNTPIQSNIASGGQGGLGGFGGGGGIGFGVGGGTTSFGFSGFGESIGAPGGSWGRARRRRRLGVRRRPLCDRWHALAVRRDPGRQRCPGRPSGAAAGSGVPGAPLRQRPLQDRRWWKLGQVSVLGAPTTERRQRRQRWQRRNWLGRWLLRHRRDDHSRQ